MVDPAKRLLEASRSLDLVVVPRAVLECVAPEEPMSQDEQGGCVWCGGGGHNPDLCATSAFEDHDTTCGWRQVREILNTPVTATVDLEQVAVMAAMMALDPDRTNRFQGFSYPDCTMVRDVYLPPGRQTMWRGAPDDQAGMAEASRRIYAEHFAREAIKALATPTQPALSTDQSG